MTIFLLSIAAVPNTPAIRAIRAEVNQINQAIKEKSYTQKQAEMCLKSGEAYFSEAYTVLDKKQTIRKIHFEGGTSDHVSRADYYFDASGKHRFSFVYLGAVNGTARETRHYFDANGKSLFEENKLLEGEGYPGGLPSAHIADAKAWLIEICR